MPIDTIYGPFCSELADLVLQTESGSNILTEDGDEIMLEQSLGAYGSPCEESEEICCREESIFVFTDEEQTEIGYSSLLLGRHGGYPQVRVFYWDGETGFLIGGTVFTRISMVGSPPTKIKIDHGGRSSGIIKLL